MWRKNFREAKKKERKKNIIADPGLHFLDGPFSGLQGNLLCLLHLKLQFFYGDLIVLLDFFQMCSMVMLLTELLCHAWSLQETFGITNLIMIILFNSTNNTVKSNWRIKMAGTYISDCFLSSLISCTEFADQLLIFIQDASYITLQFALCDSQTLVLIRKKYVLLIVQFNFY